jgi:hypothetical protein
VYPWRKDYLYHYTNAAAVMGIIQNQEIWASHYSFLNDSKEGTLAHNRLLELCDEAAESEESGVPTSNQIAAFREHLGSTSNIFVASFSQHPDSLTQYRMYCPNAGGFALGFPRSYLENCGNLIEVNYDSASLEDWCATYACEFLEATPIEASLQVKSFSTAPNCATIVAPGADFFEKVRARCIESVRFKSREFAMERECRLVVAQTSDVHVRSNSTGSLFVPYVKIKLPNESVALDLRVGPSRYPDLARMGASILSLVNQSSCSNWRIESDGSDFSFRDM